MIATTATTNTINNTITNILIVAKSTLKSNVGLKIGDGLFATEDIPKGKIIDFQGTICNKEQLASFDKEFGYIVKITKNYYLNCYHYAIANPCKCLASKANSPWQCQFKGIKAKRNCILKVGITHGRKTAALWTIPGIPIRQGDELLWSYGTSFKFKKMTKLSKTAKKPKPKTKKTVAFKSNNSLTTVTKTTRSSKGRLNVATNFFRNEFSY
jgi:hypothetical protein